jgi:gas vesicle protein
MNEERGSGSTGIILSFMVGALTGAALAILFAPLSGKETRELLGEKLREGAERGRDLKDRMVAKSRQLVDEAEGFVDRPREAIKDNKDRLAAAIEAGRDAYRGEKDRG